MAVNLKVDSRFQIFSSPAWYAMVAAPVGAVVAGGEVLLLLHGGANGS